MADAGSTATKAKSAARRVGGKSPGGGTRSRTTGGRTSGKTSGRTSATKSSRTRTSATAAAKKPSGAKTGGTTTVRRPAARTSTANGNGVNVPVPILTPHLKTLHVPAPGMSYVEDAGRVVAGYLPPPERMAFYGGLGLAAVLGAIDWPVAAAIGVGTMIARRTGRGPGAQPRSTRPQGSTTR